ncbi:helix-turn-helix transcriptional regulator [Sphingomonas sp.]|uniref:AraC family transcriptional regulator n=1 Tax=Sphingomonas sp. TaxID=28214 RepID=UPI001B149BB3|nr:helix-turn-helix transcriptional regulator [Sphingomonas sp.]MBO9713423.1 helix-turn-helix transcriptional regulator [Sphingomonas sp.]
MQKPRTAADEPYLVVRSSASDLAPGQVIGEHAHRWHQLVHAARGVLMVWTERGSWVVPSSWAVWVPAGVRHRIRAAQASAIRTLYVAPNCFPDLPEACSAITVSPLLRELVLRVVADGMLDRRDNVESATAILLLDEIKRSPVPPFGLPEPDSAATHRAVERLFAGEGERTIATIAREAGLSPRTLERRFRAETGMSLGRWRRQGALLAAIERLAAGASVKQAAAAAGYATPSAFVAAFRATFGETPGRYFDSARDG